jgi:Na+-transporting methylmalonyl-CoA/oxaloacetate decarboxylase gamma subunit
MDADLYVIGFILVVVAIVCVIWYVSQILGGYFSTEKCGTETDSTEDSRSEVTPAPSPHFVAEFELSGGLKKRETDSTEDSLSEVTPAYSPRQSGHLAPAGDANTGSDCLTVGCFVVIVILIIVYLAIAAVGEALDSFFGGVKDFSDAVESVFKGG